MAAGSAAIDAWDQYIRPIEDAEKETLRLCLCFKVFVCAPLCVFVSISTRLCLCISVRLDISISAYLCFCACITTRDPVDTDKSKAPTSPNAHFPSSASSRQRRQIITSLFFCLRSLSSFASVYPKCCCGSMRD